MGIVAALLAGACVAPVLIAVLLHSAAVYEAGNPAGLLLPFLLGLGMGLPWAFAGAGIAVLPKPGQWMMHIKHAFGVLIILVGIYYGYQGCTNSCLNQEKLRKPRDKQKGFKPVYRNHLKTANLY